MPSWIRRWGLWTAYNQTKILQTNTTLQPSITATPQPNTNITLQPRTNIRQRRAKIDGGKAILFGGALSNETNSNDRNVNDTWVYDVSENNWTGIAAVNTPKG